MATIVEETANGTIYRCPKNYPVPQVDLLTLLFDSDSCQDDTLIHISAADPQQRLSKRQARNLTGRIAHTLRQKYNVGSSGPGKDIVSCISTGHFILPAVFYGIVAAEGVFSAMSPASTVNELVQHLRQARSRVLICSELTKPIAIEAAKKSGLSLDCVLVIPEGGAQELRRASDGSNTLSHDTLEWRRITNLRELEESFIILIFSSGTTGAPKGVKLSHMNVVAESVIPADAHKAYRKIHNPNFEYRTIAHLPTSHIAGIQGYFINPFYYGGPVFWMPKFDFVQFLEYNKRYKITFFFTVPPIYLLIAKSPLVKDHFDALEYAIGGAAPMGKELQKEASAKLGKGKIHITQTWGLTETSGSITLEAEGSDPDYTGSVSMLIPNHSARIVDDDGKDVKVGSPGEIIVKGPVVTKGYYQNPKADAESFRDGWYCTGDVALWKDGRIYIVDRKKELIKYKGLQVAPAEIEALLISHQDVLDAAVVGVRLEDGNEVPRAYVVANKQKVSKQVIDDLVKGNLADFKRLRGGIVFVDTIPKSPSGKILRRELRAIANKGSSPKL